VGRVPGGSPIAAAMSMLSEADLLRGYRWTVSFARSETCLCGGVIRTETDTPHYVMETVRRHQETSRHIAWRRAHPEFDHPPDAHLVRLAEAQVPRSAQPTQPGCRPPRDLSGDRGKVVSAAQNGGSEP
jgi:hypothetical protein